MISAHVPPLTKDELAAQKFDWLVQSMKLGLHVPNVNTNKNMSNLLASWNSWQLADNPGFLIVSGKGWSMAMVTRQDRNNYGILAGDATYGRQLRQMGRIQSTLGKQLAYMACDMTQKDKGTNS